MDITFDILPVILSYIRVAKNIWILRWCLRYFGILCDRVFTRAEIPHVRRIVLSKRNVFYFLARLQSAPFLFYFVGCPVCASYLVYCTGIASNSHTPPSIRCSPRWAPNSSMYFVSYGVVSYFSFVYINYTIQNTLHMLVIGSDALNVIYYLG